MLRIQRAKCWRGWVGGVRIRWRGRFEGKTRHDAFRRDPNPNLFDPNHMVNASEPFDVEEFVRVIREGRDVRGSIGSL